MTHVFAPDDKLLIKNLFFIYVTESELYVNCCPIVCHDVCVCVFPGRVS